jgi:hypothetical protein
MLTVILWNPCPARPPVFPLCILKPRQKKPESIDRKGIQRNFIKILAEPGTIV